MRSKLTALLLVAVLIALLPGSVLVSPREVSAAICPPLVKAPWLGIEGGVNLEKLKHLDEFMNAPNKFSSDPFLWFSTDNASLHLSLGLAAPGPADFVTLLKATGPDHRIDDVEVDIADLPQSLGDLRLTRDEVVRLSLELGLDIATELRPDVGRILVTVPPDTSESVQQKFREAGPECLIIVEVGDPYVKDLISRSDIPPLKGGKRLLLVTDPPSGPNFNTICSSGFVFEEDGTGQRPLFGSSAGHCVQGAGQLVADENALTLVGTTVSPNLFFGSTPADGDAVQFDIDLSRADVTTKVIVTSDSEVTVIGHIAPSNLGMGTVVCASGGVTLNAWCGGMSRFDVTLSGQYTDFFGGGVTRTKQTQNLYCFSGTDGRGGDSGTAIYRVVAPNQAKAVGVLKGETSTDSCFTSTVLLGGRTNSHVWTGD